MLNNITNFFNLIKSGMTKTQLESSDLLPIGTRDGRYGGNYKPATIKYSDLVAGLVGGSNGQVLFNDSDTIAGASNLYWDKINERVGIGTSIPTTQMQIVGSSNASILTLTSGTRNADIAVYGSGSLFEIGTQASYPLSFKTNSTGRMIIHGGGNVGIGTATDAGYKLDVNGTSRFTGQFSTGSNINFQICQNSGNANFQVRADGYVQFNNYTPLSGTTLNILDGSRISMSGGGPLAGNVNQFAMGHLFQTNVSSDTYTGILISTTINQTGGANGITRGLYVNPTLTAAADFRAIETTAGNVLFGSNFFWDNTNGRLGIGTASPSALLHTVGSVTASGGAARGNFIQPTLVASVNNDVLSALHINPTYTLSTFTGIDRYGLLIQGDLGSSAIGNSNHLRLNGTNNANSTRFLMTNNFNSFMVFTCIGSSDTSFNSALRGKNVLVAPSGLMITSNNAGAITPTDVALTIFQNKNVAIDTTTDAGFRLDVNGTARVKTTDTSTPLNIAHSGSVGIQIEANANGYRMRLASTTTFSDISTPDSYLTLNQSGQRVVIGSSTIYNSAQLAVDSTTRGFLPPRMTNAERTAIASPAVGLMVYQTDGTEGLYIYKSTGWALNS